RIVTDGAIGMGADGALIRFLRFIDRALMLEGKREPQVCVLVGRLQFDRSLILCGRFAIPSSTVVHQAEAGVTRGPGIAELYRTVALALRELGPPVLLRQPILAPVSFAQHRL